MAIIWLNYVTNSYWWNVSKNDTGQRSQFLPLLSFPWLATKDTFMALLQEGSRLDHWLKLWRKAWWEAHNLHWFVKWGKNKNLMRCGHWNFEIWLLLQHSIGNLSWHIYTTVKMPSSKTNFEISNFKMSDLWLCSFTLRNKDKTIPNWNS